MIEIRIKSLKNEDVKIDIEATSLSVTAQLPISSAANGGNSEYRYVISYKHILTLLDLKTIDSYLFLNLHNVKICCN